MKISGYISEREQIHHNNQCLSNDVLPFKNQALCEILYCTHVSILKHCRYFILYDCHRAFAGSNTPGSIRCIPMRQSSPKIIQNTQYVLWTLSAITSQNQNGTKSGATLNIDGMEGVAFQEAGFESGETY